MKIEDDTKLHSHYILELFENQNLLRQRTHDLNEKIAVHSYIIKTADENIMESLKNQKEFQNTLIEMKSQFDVFKKNDEKRKSNIEFFKELFEKKSNWFIVFGLILLIESVKGLEISTVIKHFMGML